MAHLQAIAGGALVPPLPPTFRETLLNVCRLGPLQADCLIDEGYDDVAELRNWEPDAVDSWCKAKTKLARNRGGCVFGDPKIRNIQAFAYWATDMHRRGRSDDLIGFDIDALGKYKETVRVIEPKTRRTRDRRQAMLDLKHHFDGDDEKYKRLEKSKNMIENLHYKNEQYMSWHIFSTCMKKAFDTVELCDPPGFTERTMVDTLLKKVQSNNQVLQTVGSNSNLE